MNTGIYQIRNVVNGKIYIGSAVRLKQRLIGHRTGLDRGDHHNPHLQSAWNKYGAGAFEMRILLFCVADDLLFYEQRCLNAFDAVKRGYNKCPVAGNTRGRIQSAESLARMAATKRGKRRSPESLARQRETLNNPELKARIAAGVSAALRGKPKSPEHIRNAALAQCGKRVSPETREKLRQANLGKKNGPHSPETRLKISQSQKGRKFTVGHIANLCKAQRSSKRTPESRRLGGVKAYQTRLRNLRHDAIITGEDKRRLHQ
jgi:group I intron endonuclease